MTHRHTAAELIELVADPGSFSPWDSDVVSTDPLEFHDSRPYRERLAEAEQRSGVTEAIVAGRATMGGRDVVLILGEFSFLGGTLGVATAERVIRAFERATEMRVPVVALPISGGTRMQEGVAGFVRMASCAAAVQRFRDAGLLYIAYLRNPTMGGVLGSWASLAHLTFAEPGALIGLTGPRVIKTVATEPLDEGVQGAENLLRHGVIDEIVEPTRLRDRLCQVLDFSDPQPRPWRPALAADLLPDNESVQAWEAVEASRSAQRATVMDVLQSCDAEFVRLRGDGAGNDDEHCLVGLGRICGVTAVLLGQQRDDTTGGRGAAIGAAGYRQYRRGIELAGELGLPVVSLIDTQGAAMTRDDEEGGLAAMIAGCLAALAAVPTPTLAVLLGEGSGGGAVALLPADHVVAAQHAWLAPILPEGAAAILYRSTERASEVAAAQGISSTDLRRLGIVDQVVPDTDAQFPPRMAATIAAALTTLLAQPDEERRNERRERYRTGIR